MSCRLSANAARKMAASARAKRAPEGMRRTWRASVGIGERDQFFLGLGNRLVHEHNLIHDLTDSYGGRRAGQTDEIAVEKERAERHAVPGCRDYIRDRIPHRYPHMATWMWFQPTSWPLNLRPSACDSSRPSGSTP